MACDYRLITCTGCQLEVLQKNFAEHQAQCPMTVKTCADCQMVYQQNNSSQIHSDVICLKEQFRQLQLESQYEIEQLKQQIRQAQSKIRRAQ